MEHMYFVILISIILIVRVESVFEFGVHPGLRELLGAWQAEYYYYPSYEYPNGAKMYGNYTFNLAMDHFVERNFNATLEYVVDNTTVIEQSYQIRLTMNYDPLVDKFFTIFLTNKGNYKAGYGFYDWNVLSLNWTLKAQEKNIGVDGSGDQIVIMRKIDHLTQEVTIYTIDPLTNATNLLLHGYEHRVNFSGALEIPASSPSLFRVSPVLIITFTVFISFMSFVLFILCKAKKRKSVIQ